MFSIFSNDCVCVFSRARSCTWRDTLFSLYFQWKWTKTKRRIKCNFIIANDCTETSDIFFLFIYVNAHLWIYFRSCISFSVFSLVQWIILWIMKAKENKFIAGKVIVIMMDVCHSVGLKRLIFFDKRFFFVWLALVQLKKKINIEYFVLDHFLLDIISAPIKTEYTVANILNMLSYFSETQLFMSGKVFSPMELDWLLFELTPSVRACESDQRSIDF